eukprot:TRINITY_DN72387_c0_g1_i1.p1 TRINITY_DN72387_c0_g1~~TRINITY_DN72387_c0_g1_i1.p1  ORF type:complete len:939 (-),score=157.98 TRINITY_DN72387_c0_g1_i1:341-2806(-)
MDHTPIWHVVVLGVDKPRVNLPVSIYFLQNLDELMDLARECLIQFLDQDEPAVLQQAVDNAQFQDWCRQWYQQSEDASYDKSVRYICRLKGCAVLSHCIHEKFGQCVEFLLSQYSDITAPEPWLVLAEPLRYFGHFQCNAFHEAAYCGASEALDALIRYGNAHSLSWKEAVDVEGKTALEIAKSRAEKGHAGCETCFLMLQVAYGVRVEVPSAPLQQSLLENVLVVSWFGDDAQEVHRIRQPLPLEASFNDLISASRAALMNSPSVGATPQVLVYKAIVTGCELDDVMNFLELWSEATSIGFVKSFMRSEQAPLSVCKAMRTLLTRPAVPAWRRTYFFGTFYGIALSEDNAATLGQLLRDLADTLASRPELPLWRLDHFPANLLNPSERYISSLLGAALDVKKLLHQLREGKEIYRFFWPRLEAIEFKMLDRMRLLTDTSIRQLEQAIAPEAVAYFESCVRLWILAIGCDDDDDNDDKPDGLVRRGQCSQAQFQQVLEQLDLAFCGAFCMRSTLPGLVEALGRALPEKTLHHFPATAESSLKLGCGRGVPPAPAKRAGPRPLLPGRLTQAAQLRPSWQRPKNLRLFDGGVPSNNRTFDEMRPEDSSSNAGIPARSHEAVEPKSQNPLPSDSLDSSAHSEVSQATSLLSSAGGGGKCFLSDALFRVPDGSYVEACKLYKDSVVCGQTHLLEVRSIEIHRGDVELMELQSDAGVLVVTASHRVMVQRKGGPQTVPAGKLKPGESVLTSGGQVEELLQARPFKTYAEIVEVTFNPDEPVGAFHPPMPAILSKGQGRSKTLRRPNKAVHSGVERQSIPDTDYGDW